MPKYSIVVTDLTRFKDEQSVCVAGMNTVNGQCIRPMPYLAAATCEKLHILPGAILTGIFTSATNISGPHKEDTFYEGLTFNGACTSAQFKHALESGLFGSVEEGFELELSVNQKSVPLGHKLNRSIITIKVDPKNIELVEDEYNLGRIKMNLTDGSGHYFKNLPITDLGFYRHAMAHHKADDLESLNSFIQNQELVYIRLGLGRNWVKRPGYWMQVNGIYTFPEFQKEIRSYG